MIRPFASLAPTLALTACSSPSPDAAPLDGGTEAANGPLSDAGAATNDTGPAASSSEDAALANQTITSDNDNDVMSAQAREYERREYKPVRLSSLTSGDNVYLEVTPDLEGAAPKRVLCTARHCADWRDAGGLPSARKGQRVGAKFGTADQVDGAGSVMARGVEAIVALRLPAARRASSAPGPVPLTPGVYVLEDADCRNPANAAFRIWNGQGLSGSATRDCRAEVLSRKGESYTLSNSCVNTYDGSRTPERLVMRVPDQVHFEVNGSRFRSCSMAQVPEALRRLVRPSS